MSELKRCPFCGGEAKLVQRGNSIRHFVVKCLGCRGEMKGKTEKYAVDSWNNRADHSGEANKMVSNADKIRSMSDEELAEFLLKWIACDKESHMCCPKEYKESGNCDGKCIAGRVAWLRQPAKEESNL